MNVKWLLTRRAVVAAGTSIAAYAFAAPSKAQEIRSFDIEAFAKTIADPVQLYRILLDVDFLRSWRVELSPKGYEDAKWRDEAASFARAIYDKTSQNPGIVFSRSTEILSNLDRGQSSYKENREEYESFLTEIGITSDSKVALRLLTSMRDYLALSTGADPEATKSAQAASYFWPFC